MKKWSKLLFFSLVILLPFISCNNTPKNEDPEFIDFGVIKFNEPFQGIIASRPWILEKSLEYPPYSWAVPDTPRSQIALWIDVNPEAVRGNATSRLQFSDTTGKKLPITFLINNTSEKEFILTSDSLHKTLDVTAIVPYYIKNEVYDGRLIIYSTDLDSINRLPVNSDSTIANQWTLEHKQGYALGLWVLWILTAILILFLLYLLGKALITLILFLIGLVSLSRINIPVPNGGRGERKPREKKSEGKEIPDDKKKWITDPWEGSDYKNSTYFEHRVVMGLGDYHYCANPADFTSDITINTIENLFAEDHIHEPYMTTYAKFINATIGRRLKTNAEKKWGWDQICFYNYTQFPMTSPASKPTNDQYKASEPAFWAVLEQLKPTHIIVWGYRLFNNMPAKKRKYVGKIRIMGFSVAKVYEYRVGWFKNAKILRMKSPAFAFPTRYWAKIIDKFLNF